MVVYRLVNSIYVLAITSADQNEQHVNVYDCTKVVSQAVRYFFSTDVLCYYKKISTSTIGCGSVLVAACRGIHVTPEKINRKYSQVSYLCCAQ